jgi:hypothetical protein
MLGASKHPFLNPRAARRVPATLGTICCIRSAQKARIFSVHLRPEKEAFYSFFVKSMLKLDDGPLKAAKVIIDGSGDRVFKREMGAYFRRHLGAGKVKSIQFSNSTSDRLVQLADMCAGAIARSFNHERRDRNRWRDMLGPKVEHVWEFP